MLNFTDFSKMKTPTDVIAFQTNMAKSVLAYVPNEEVRAGLTSVLEMNAALASAVWDAYFSYADALKSKVLAA